MVRVLILGGTGDAVELAAQAAQISTIEVITSLAGRTRHPIAPSGSTRVGGFGGADGLTAYLRESQIDLLIDATHPFAAQMSWNAATAATAANIPHLMLIRPAWTKVTDDRWIEVVSVDAAAKAIPPDITRVFLTIGRQQLAPFVPLTNTWFLLRSIDPPASELMLPNGKLILDRGPFTLENERSLLLDYRIEAIVSKNSGGDATYSKIIAARELNIPVIMVDQPPMPPGERVTDVSSALRWLQQHIKSA